MNPRPRRRAPLPLLAALLLVTLLGAGEEPQTTRAALSDRAVVGTGSLAAASLAPVTGLRCTAGAVGLLSVRFDWDAQPARPYRVVVLDAADGRVLRGPVDTASNSYTIGGGLLAGGRFRLEVRSSYTAPGPGASPWLSTPTSTGFSQNTAGLAFSCG